ncbi:acetyltransferase [Alloalcanivorax profundimaris]|uniref:acetyltransferase n=1 Tax=Alloalcanivorax profundimaris TaxID=2735259 RepID=UPI0018890E8C|nr:acetyltransferase [Alloalcanivorax profundimaris]MBF1801802.1 acetyltransferase [Alloalcanivorax profundimaris]
MKRLAILGASGHGKVVADAALCAGWDEVCFFDDAWPRLSRNGPWSVEGAFSGMLGGCGPSFQAAVVGIGHNATRLAKMSALREAGIPLVTVVHPSAVISAHAHLGEGCMVFAGAVVNVDTRIAAGCILNTGATVDHDCCLEEGVHISPGANLAGGVTVGAGSWVGIGASVRQGVAIGRNVMVGAGAAVVSNIPDDVTVVGVPARVL